MLYIYLTYSRGIMLRYIASVRRILDQRWEPCIWANLKPFNVMSQWMGFKRLSSRAVIQAEFSGLHYYRGLKLLEA